jgi:hypothetical protein
MQLHIAQVPVLYRPDLSDDEAAQVEELLASNAGRQKTREQVAREWRLAFQTFKKQVGKVEGEKSRDVVGKRFGVSGVTLSHGIAVVDALESRGLDITTRDKVRQVLEQRGVEPAWKLLTKTQPESTDGPFSGDSGGLRPNRRTAIPASKRQKALLTSWRSSTRARCCDRRRGAGPGHPREAGRRSPRCRTSIPLGNPEGEIRDRLTPRNATRRRR